MNKKNFLAVLLVGVGILIGGCGQKQESVPPIAYGVADFETLVKAHPKYSEYFRLETEYNQMTEQYSRERNQMIKIYSVKTQFDNSLQDKKDSEFAQKELESRIKVKEDELNKRLKKLYDDISGKHSSINIKNDYALDENAIRIANLQMKLIVLGTNEEEKTIIENELQKLLSERIVSDENMLNWSEEEKKVFLREKENATKELEKFVKNSAEEIKLRLNKKLLQSIDQKENLYPELESWDKSWQKKLELKQKQMAKIKSQITDDIRKEAEKIALEKKLSMIFSDYSVNVDAIDVTGDIVSNIVQEE